MPCKEFLEPSTQTKTNLPRWSLSTANAWLPLTLQRLNSSITKRGQTRSNKDKQTSWTADSKAYITMKSSGDGIDNGGGGDKRPNFAIRRYERRYRAKMPRRRCEQTRTHSSSVWHLPPEWWSNSDKQHVVLPMQTILGLDTRRPSPVLRRTWKRVAHFAHASCWSKLSDASNSNQRLVWKRSG